jgi:hypothetical protein
MKLGKLQFDSMWMRIAAMAFVFCGITGVAYLKGTPLTDSEERQVMMMCATFLVLDLLSDILKALAGILDELKKSSRSLDSPSE